VYVKNCSLRMRIFDVEINKNHVWVCHAAAMWRLMLAFVTDLLGTKQDPSHWNES
jgi:hypothetical protein